MHPDDADVPHEEESTIGVFTDLGDAEIQPPKWVVENALPEGFVIIGGPPKGGKSTLTVGWALAVAGQKCDALPEDMRVAPEHGSVLWFSYEATAGELKHIAQAGLGAEIESNGSIMVADDPWSWRLDNERSVADMLMWLDKRRPKLMILDPLRNFHQLDENDSRIIQLLTPLRKWAVTNGSCVVVVHHAVKPDKDTGKFTANHLRGSGALFGMADAVIMVTPLNPQRTHLYLDGTFKRANAIQKDIRLKAWGDTGEAPLEAEDIKDIDRMVLSCFITQPTLEVDDVKKHTNLPMKRVLGIIEKLVKLGKLTKDGSKCSLVRRDDE